VIENGWRRIAGIHCQQDGEKVAVWLAHDKTADVVHLYDCVNFRRAGYAVIVDGMIARGRWVPIAWEAGSKEIIEKLLDRGCNTLPEPVKQTQVLAEAIVTDIEGRMETGRFKVERWLSEWLDEYRSFQRDEGLVPLKSHPFMSATRYAMEDLDFAKAQGRKGKDANITYPKVAMI
jgi:hypothetical protein